jgi:hypothetical protein
MRMLWLCYSRANSTAFPGVSNGASLLPGAESLPCGDTKIACAHDATGVATAASHKGATNKVRVRMVVRIGVMRIVALGPMDQAMTLYDARDTIINKKRIVYMKVWIEASKASKMRFRAASSRDYAAEGSSDFSSCSVQSSNHLA